MILNGHRQMNVRLETEEDIAESVLKVILIDKIPYSPPKEALTTQGGILVSGVT